MVEISGKSISKGTVKGVLAFYKRECADCPRFYTEDSFYELERYVEAREAAVGELSLLYDIAVKKVGDEFAKIIEIQQMMIEDNDFCAYVSDIIKCKKCNAEYAVRVASNGFFKVLAECDNEYMRERAGDVVFAANRTIRRLEGKADCTAKISENCILCSDFFTPGEILLMDSTKLSAVASREGSMLSHTAILAEALGIISIVDLGYALDDKYEGRNAIVDCDKAKLIIDFF